MLNYQPEKIRKNAWIVFGFISSIAVMFYVFSLFGLGVKWINQLALALVLVVDIMYLIRYLLYDYVYVINEHGYFTVTRVYGKNNRLLADIKITRGDVIIKYDTNTDLSRYGRIEKKENFCSSAFPLSKYIYIFSSGGAKNAFVIECGEDTAKIIADAIEKFGSENDFYD